MLQDELLQAAAFIGGVKKLNEEGNGTLYITAFTMTDDAGESPVLVEEYNDDLALST